MRKYLSAPISVLVSLAIGVIDAQACGDKFLVVGSGVTYHGAYTAPHPASILIYRNPDSDVLAAVKDLDLQATLGIAGHKFEAVDSPSALDQALKTGKYDIVLVDLDDAEALKTKMVSTPSRPAVLPVIYNPSKPELAAARARYQQILKAPSKTGHLLAVIERVMEVKLDSAKQGKGSGR